MLLLKCCAPIIINLLSDQAEAHAGMVGGLTASRAENGTFRVGGQARQGEQQRAISNRKPRQERERTDSNGGCCL